MRTKFRPDQAGPPWAKDALYRYVAFLEKLIKDLLTSSEVQLTAGERENLEYAVRTFRPAVNLLAERYFEPLRASQPWVCDAGYMTLLEVMQATNFASSHAIIRDTVKSFVQRSHAKAARDRRASLNASEIERRRAAVREAMKTTSTKPRKSSEYAGLIRPVVLKRLGLTEGSKSPSASTIKGDVRAILKEIPEDSDNA